jgi:hypothetical protein
MTNAGNVAKLLLYSHFHRLSTEISTISSQTSAMLCLVRQTPNARRCMLSDAISVSREQRKQQGSNFQNISNVSWIFIKSKCGNLLTAESKKFCTFILLYSITGLILFFLSSLSGTDKESIPNAGYKANLAEKPIQYQRLFPGPV